MDDTTRRITNDRDDLSGRGADDISSVSPDGVRGYADVNPGRRDSSDDADYSRDEGRMRRDTTVRPEEDDDDVRRRTSEIRQEIEQTREEMSETVNAIQDRLRPRNIVANATEQIKQKTTEKVRDMTESAGETARYVGDRSRDAVGGLMGTIREHPVPAMMATFGIAWLAFAGSGKRSRMSEQRYDSERYRRPYRGSEYRSEYRAEPGAYDNTWTSSEAGNVGERGRDYTSGASDRLRETGRRAQNQMQRAMSQNPLLVGAGALLVGAAFGLAIPETETENEWMGETRDEVVDRAQDMARDAVTKVQDVATQVKDTASGVLDSTLSKENTKPGGNPS